MKTTIVFRQGGNNSRIGNTFYWVENAKSWCEKHGFNFCFPTGQEIFKDLFDDVSHFFKLPTKLRGSLLFENFKEYNSLFGRIGHTINSVEQKTGNTPRVFEVIPDLILHITAGVVDWDNDDLLTRINKYLYVIVEEPYPFKIATQPTCLLNVSEKVSDILNSNRKDLIAVHVRQGDYKYWRNGQFYKEDVFYNELLLTLVDKFQPDYEVSVVHNGEFKLQDGLKSKVLECPDYGFEPHINDLITLAMSNTVIGPFSTFSKLAMDVRNRSGLEQQKLIHFNEDWNVDDVLEKVN